MMTESPDSESPDQTRRRLKKLKDNLVPPTIGGSIGVGCAIAITLPGAYSTFQGVFSNGFGWGIAALCLLGGVVGGLAKAIAMRFGLPGMNQVTPIVGVASGMAIMVGTGVASVVYRSISEFTGWGHPLGGGIGDWNKFDVPLRQSGRLLRKYVFQALRKAIHSIMIQR